MRKTDNKRLSKAIFISIILHVLLLSVMNFFNWFPADNIRDKYTPLTVKIESRIVEASSDEIKIENHEAQIETSVTETVARPIEKSVRKVETAFDPYADLSLSDYSSSSLSEPEPLEKGVQQTPFIPGSENKIEYEDLPTNTETNNSISSVSTSTDSKDNEVSVVSDNEFSDLKSAISGNNDQKVSGHESQIDSESRSFEYRDVPVEFDIPGESRELLTNPPPEIPNDLPSDFPPEITYSIRFSLNSDGLIKVLSITPSSVYPKIDASIRKALRSWTFKRSSDTELVEGTITLIFKGK